MVLPVAYLSNRTGMLAVGMRLRSETMKERGRQILMIGGSSTLLEGVTDLLQLAGHQVDTSSTWAETRDALNDSPPHLAIVDVSSSVFDTVRLYEQIDYLAHCATAPILVISFSDDDRIRELRRRSRDRNGNIQFYTQTLLGVDGLVDKVEACIA
jgi:PleD family two-component response regulator